MTRKELLIQEAARYIARSQPQNLPEAFGPNDGFGAAAGDQPGGIPKRGRPYTSEDLKKMRKSPRTALTYTLHYREPLPQHAKDIHNTLKNSKEHGEQYKKYVPQPEWDR